MYACLCDLCMHVSCMYDVSMYDVSMYKSIYDYLCMHNVYMDVCMIYV